MPYWLANKTFGKMGTAGWRQWGKLRFLDIHEPDIRVNGKCPMFPCQLNYALHTLVGSAQKFKCL